MTARRAVTAVFFANGALMATWASRIPALAARTHAEAATLGLALLAPALASIITMPLVGRHLSRRPSAPATRVALLTLAAAVVAPGLAHSVPALAGALLLIGIGNSALDVSMNIQGVTVERRLGRPILSSLHAAYSFGGFAGAGLGALAATLAVAPLPQFAVVAAVAGGAGLLAARGLEPRDAESATDPGDAATATTAATTTRSRRRMPAGLLLLGAACFCSFVGEGGASDWSAKLVHGSLGGSAAIGAIAFASFSAAMGLGRLVADAGWRRWGAVGLLRRSGLLAAIGFGAGLAIGAPVAAVAGFAALGLGLSGAAPTLFRAAADHPGISSASGLATVTTIGYTGFLAGPPIIGGIAQASSLPVACGLLVLTALLVALLPAAASRRVAIR